MVTRYRLDDLETPTAADDERSLPAISYVVPVYDDPEGIADTVASIEATDYPSHRIHAVVTPADGATQERLAELSERHDSLVVHVEDRYETPAAARNVALDAVDGDLVVFVDADMTVATSFPYGLTRVFRESSIDYLGYPVTIQPVEGEETVFGFYDRSIRFPVEFLLEEVAFAPTCSLAVRSEVIEDGVRFEPELDTAEDVVFGHRVDDRGYELGYCPDLEVYHPARNSLGEIYEKGRKTGVGFYQEHTQLPEDHVVTRSWLLTTDAYRPRPREYFRRTVRDWEDRSLREKLLIGAIEYVENLSRTWGYLQTSVQDRLGGAGRGDVDPAT